jgi:hypothetical protein
MLAHPELPLQPQAVPTPVRAAAAETASQPQEALAPVNVAAADPSVQPLALTMPAHKRVVAMDAGNGCNACDPSFVQPDARKLAALGAARARVRK